MKLPLIYISFLALLFCSCAEDNDDNLTAQTHATISFEFTHNWDDTSVTSADFDALSYTNANGETMSIEKLRYLISDVTFHLTTGENIVVEGYNLVDVTEDNNLVYTLPQDIEFGSFSNVSFTFGFDNEDNYNNSYPDLNSASWNVPDMMGGGYHYMPVEGKSLDGTSTEVGYAYPAIRAVNLMATPMVFEDTFFDVDLGPMTIGSDTNIEVKMNIAEWFKNPNTWDLNTLNSNLMGNFDAQVMMYENGQNVFTLGAVTQE